MCQRGPIACALYTRSFTSYSTQRSASKTICHMLSPIADWKQFVICSALLRIFYVRVMVIRNRAEHIFELFSIADCIKWHLTICLPIMLNKLMCVCLFEPLCTAGRICQGPRGNGDESFVGVCMWPSTSNLVVEEVVAAAAWSRRVSSYVTRVYVHSYELRVCVCVCVYVCMYIVMQHVCEYIYLATRVRMCYARRWKRVSKGK